MNSKTPDELESESSSGQVEVYAKEVETSQPTLTPSSRTVFRLKARLIGHLPSNPVDLLDLFIMSLYSSLLLLYWTQKTMSILVHCLCAKGVIGLNESASCWRTPLKKQTLFLLKYWRSKLVSNTLIVSILDGIGLEIPAELSPKSVAVKKFNVKLCLLHICYDVEHQSIKENKA